MSYKILFVFGLLSLIRVRSSKLLSLIRVRPSELKCYLKYENLNNTCYFFSEFSESLQYAKQFCGNYNGRLVEINSDEELNMLINYSNFEKFWVKISNDMKKTGKSSFNKNFNIVYYGDEKKYGMCSIGNTKYPEFSIVPFICESKDTLTVKKTWNVFND